MQKKKTTVKAEKETKKSSAPAASTSSSNQSKTSPPSIDYEDQEMKHVVSQQALFDRLTAQSGKYLRTVIILGVVVTCLEIYLMAVFFRAQSTGTFTYLALFACTFLLVKELHKDWIEKRGEYYESFNVKNNRKDYIRLDPADYKSDIEDLYNGEDVIVHYKKIQLQIEYPLSNVNVRTITAKEDQKGFTRKEVASLIAKQYARIYSEEDKNATTRPAFLVEDRLNHFQTNGQHGIWGWSLSSLRCSGVVIKPNPSDSSIAIVTPTMESVDYEYYANGGSDAADE